MSNKNKVLPNFLGIGATKSGTTWLAEILKSHPQIYLPPDKKEIHFFDKFYDKGLDWYRQFFPGKKESFKYKAIGEFTPTYMNPEYSGLIKKCLPGAKFITVLRNPVEKTYSGLKYGNLHRKKESTVDSYLQKLKEKSGSSLYSQALKDWLKKFKEDKLLILIYEDLKTNPEKELKKISAFLEVDCEGFNKKTIKQYYNQTLAPRNKKIFIKGRGLIHKLRSKNWDKLANLIKKIGLPFIFQKKTYPPLSKEEEEKLKNFYKKEVEEVEKIIGREIPAWKK